MAAGSIIHQPEMVIVGFRDTVEPKTGIGGMWKRLYDRLEANDLDTSNLQQVGIIFKISPDARFDYMAGLAVPSRDVARAVGLDAVVLDERDYACIFVEGSVPLSTMSGVDYLVKDYLPQTEYKKAGPVLEIYGPGDPSLDTYRMQVWIPVTK